MLLLAFVTAARCLAFARGGTSTSSDAPVVGARDVGEGGQDGSTAVLAGAHGRDEEGEEEFSDGSSMGGQDEGSPGERERWWHCRGDCSRTS